MLLEGNRPYFENEARSERFYRALLQPPIYGVLFEEGKWTSFFLEGVNKVEEACINNNICHHEFDHIFQVSNNVFTLMDTLPIYQDQHADSQGLFLSFIHDLGYGFRGVQWENYHAYNHPTYGAEVMSRFERMYLSGKLSTIHPSHVALQRDHMLNYLTVSGTTEEIVEFSRTSLIPLIVRASDKLDYFRRKRLEGLPKPSRYEDNPYYFLCEVVKDYHINFEGQVLYYVVSLEKNGLDFDTWKNEVQKYYPSVFEVPKSFAEIIGGKFVVALKKND